MHNISMVNILLLMSPWIIAYLIGGLLTCYVVYRLWFQWLKRR